MVDLAFFAPTLLKISDGGWFPLAIGARLSRPDEATRRGREAPVQPQLRLRSDRGIPEITVREYLATSARDGGISHFRRPRLRHMHCCTA